MFLKSRPDARIMFRDRRRNKHFRHHWKPIIVRKGQEGGYAALGRTSHQAASEVSSNSVHRSPIYSELWQTPESRYRVGGAAD